VAEPEKALEIAEAIRSLQEFKGWLDKNCTRETFTDPENLAKLVAISLANLSRSHGSAPASVARSWSPLFCHALQPAQHFRGRVAHLRDLVAWLESPVTPDRVVSLVAMGGTGKTALAHEALYRARFSGRAGIFVWSFYEDPHTDAFLRAAYLYFTGDATAPSGGMLERLQMALSGDAPHLLVLDGLERVQSEGGTRRRGELEDPQVKRLLRALAGGAGNTRALVTSRFPLTDLDEYTGAGHRPISLDDLDLSVALDVLRAWGVHGDDATLASAIAPLAVNEVYHALSVAVLGSYLGNFAGGDPSRAPDFSLAEAAEVDDPKARRLSRILGQYAKVLQAAERDLIARLSLFPRGIEIELLCWIAEAGGAIAGALVGLSEHKLMVQLDRLRALGLVFRYPTDGRIIFSAHPFLREFFRNLLGTDPESVHESVRARLAPSLEAQPTAPPSDPKMLDRYELLIEQTLLAGRTQEAFDLYWFRLGNYENLGRVLGESARGLRILERFVPGDNFLCIEPLLVRDRSALVNDLGLFAKNLGDLARARSASGHGRALDASAGDRRNESADVQNLADIELLAGRFPQALEVSETTLSLARAAEDGRYVMLSLAYRATSRFALGDTAPAEADFARATELGGAPLYSHRGIREAEWKLLRSDRVGALAQTEANWGTCGQNGWGDDLCRCNTLLARLLAPDDPAKAGRHLEEARAFASRSGVVELQLRSFHAACELCRCLIAWAQSIAEVQAGILLADTCGYGKYSIDLRLALAETLLAAGDPRQALPYARAALDRSEAPNCQYAWGQADGLHFCGLAHLRLGERELARQRLTAALALRERIGHGRTEETRRALGQLA